MIRVHYYSIRISVDAAIGVLWEKNKKQMDTVKYVSKNQQFHSPLKHSQPGKLIKFKLGNKIFSLMTLALRNDKALRFLLQALSWKSGLRIWE